MFSKELISYTIAFFLVTLVGVYGLNMPGLISGQPQLVYEYYYLNWRFFIPLDYLLVAIYLLAAHYVAKKTGVKENWKYLLVLAATTAVISGSFWLYFTSKPLTTNFFSTWFHRAGIKAVIYDVVLLIMIFLVYKGIINIF